MSSDQLQLKINNEQLTPAEDRFTEFKRIKTAKEMDDQRRLLDFTGSPQVILHRKDLKQEHVWKEEALDDQRRNSCFNEKEPEPLQMKEEQGALEHFQIKEEAKEACISQNEEELGLKQETKTLMVTPAHEEFHTEPEANWNQLNFPPETDNEEQEKRNLEVSGVMMDEEQMHWKTRHHNDTRSSPEKGRTETHSNKKLYFCEMCDKGFSLNKNLIAHMRIHTGERPFSCKTCGTCFTKKSNLTRHLKAHTGEKPFSCDACKKTFSLKRDLVKHMRIHTGEKPFLCMTCGKRFRLKFILTEHTRTHTGERPFPCDACKKTFSLKRNVVKHMRNCGKHLKSTDCFDSSQTMR